MSLAHWRREFLRLAGGAGMMPGANLKAGLAEHEQSDLSFADLKTRRVVGRTAA